MPEKSLTEKMKLKVNQRAAVINAPEFSLRLPKPGKTVRDRFGDGSTS